jgi:hypothetical protein
VKVPIEIIARFMKEGWPGDDYYMDDFDEATWNEHMDEYYNVRTPGAMVNPAEFSGFIGYQGNDPEKRRIEWDWLNLFKKWYQTLDTAFFAVQVPKDKLEDVKAAVVAAGGKVIQ